MRKLTRIVAICLAAAVLAVPDPPLLDSSAADVASTRAPTEVDLLRAAPSPKAATGSSVPAPVWVRARKNSKTSIKIWWQRVDDAAGYRVYRWDSRKNAYARIKTITKNTRTSFVDTKRKTGREYRYVVQAFNVKDGRRFGGPTSHWVSAVAYKKNARVVNAGRISWADKTRSPMVALTLSSKGRSAYSTSTEAQVAPSRYSRASDKRVVNSTVRASVESGNTLVSVESTRAETFFWPKGIGNVKLRLLAHDGLSTLVTLRIVDYSTPSKFYYEQFQPGSASRLLLEQYGGQLGRIAHGLQELALTGSWPHRAMYVLGDDGSLKCEAGSIAFDGEHGISDSSPIAADCVSAPRSLTDSVDKLVSDFRYPIAVAVDGQSGVVNFLFNRTPDWSGQSTLIIFNPSKPEPVVFFDDGRGAQLPRRAYNLAPCWTMYP